MEGALGEELGPTLQGGGARQPGRAVDHFVLLQAGGLRVRRRFLALQEADPKGRLPSDHAAVVVDLST